MEIRYLWVEQRFVFRNCVRLQARKSCVPLFLGWRWAPPYHISTTKMLYEEATSTRDEHQATRIRLLNISKLLCLMAHGAQVQVPYNSDCIYLIYLHIPPMNHWFQTGEAKSCIEMIGTYSEAKPWPFGNMWLISGNHCDSTEWVKAISR